MEANLAVSLLAASGPITAAVFVVGAGLVRRKNNHVVNPHDPDATPVGQVSVGYLLKAIKLAVKEGVKEATEEL